LDIIVPMQTLIDYKGYRVVTLPLLDISGETLVYGSGDGGKTIKIDDDVVSVLTRASAQLYLAVHPCAGRTIPTAGDVEVHKNPSGDHFFLDLARCFPPESPTEVEKFNDLEFLATAVFFRMMRPELLQIIAGKKDEETSRSFGPVSPDSLSQWGKVGREEFNDMNVRVTRYLLQEQTKQAAVKLSKLHLHELESLTISKEFHHLGLNMRHLALVRNSQWCKSQDLKMFLLQEIVTRTLKNLMRKYLRKEILVGKSLADISNLMLLCLSSRRTEEMSHFRNIMVEDMKKRFGSSTSKIFQPNSTEKESLERLSRSHSISKIIFTVFLRVGIVIESDEVRKASSSPQFLFDDTDFSHFGSSVKKMPLFDICLAERIIASADVHEENMKQQSCRLRKKSVNLLSKTLDQDPENNRVSKLLTEQTLKLLAISQDEKEIEFQLTKLNAITKESFELKFLETIIGVPQIRFSESFISQVIWTRMRSYCHWDF
jgi:hypothetical protein